VSVTAALVRVGIPVLLGILGLSLLNYLLRFVRWQIYLKRLGHQVPWATSLRIYFAGFALTTTPGKMGELMRGVLLKPLGVPLIESSAAFFSERAADLLVILLLSSAVFWLPQRHAAGHRPVRLRRRHHRPGPVSGLAACACQLGRKRNRARWKRAIAHLYPGPRFPALLPLDHAVLRRRSRPDRLGRRSLRLSLAAGCLGHRYTGRCRSSSIPSPCWSAAPRPLPGGLGGSEAVMMALLIANGLPEAAAVTATLICRLATLWFAVALGAVFLARSR
jgi:hypothetical protein